MDGLFGRRAPVVVDIGFGNGEALLAMAAADPERGYLGIEVYRPGIGHCLLQLAARELSNVRLLAGDAQELLPLHIADGCLDQINIFFPDPWPKKRHHKRRLIQPEFVSLLQRKLRPGGNLHLATDWQGYAEQMLAVLGQADGLVNSAGPGKYSDRPGDRPPTKFECRGRSLGYQVYDLVFRRCV